jgi:Domain of unknown function (DUF4350)
MTAPALSEAQTTPVPAPHAPTAARRRRRWYRVAVPFAVFLTLVVGTLVLHSMNEPARTDPAFLAPSPSPGAALFSGNVLAQRLADRGVHVERVTQTSRALELAYRGGVTLFVPSPSLMHRDYLRMLWQMPGNTRVVLVDPSASDLTRGAVPITTATRRWATAAVGPGTQPCAIDGLADAGTAAVLHSAYAVNPDKLLNEHSCYQGAVLQFHWTVTDVVAVGSADPFRDDRIDEFDNSSLAVGLLSTHQRLVWLDVHETEPGPLVDPDAEPGDGMPPSLAPDQGNGTPGQDDGTGQGGDPGQLPGGGGPGGDPDGDPGDQAGGDQGPSFFDAFPPALWATLVGALLLGLLLALWQGRRLGPPVAEPLPFAVRGAETVLGRARLYQRAGAIITGAQTLRRSVGPQIAQALGLPPTTAPPKLAAAIADRYGGDPEEYLALLSDKLPARDSDLVVLAGNLDSLLTMVSTPLAPEPGADDTGAAPRGETRG